MKEVKLREICRIEKGKQIDTSQLRTDSPYKYINGGIKESGYYHEYNTDSEAVLVSEGGASCGYVNYVNEKFWCGCHCYKLTESKTLAKYLYYALKGNQDKIMELRSGAAMPNIKKEVFKNMSLLVDFDKNNQQAIVETLDCIQKAINNKTDELSSLDELVKSRFIEMFENKGFPQKTGKELFKFSSGKFLPSERRLNSGIPVYGGNGIAWYTDTTLIPFDTLVIGRVGAYCGNVRLVKGNKWITDNALYISSFKTKDYSLEFLEELMKMCNFHQFADASAQPKITQKPLENLTYIIPPIKLQNEFAEFVKLIDKSKFIVQQQIKDLQELLDSKMDEYFR